MRSIRTAAGAGDGDVALAGGSPRYWIPGVVLLVGAASLGLLFLTNNVYDRLIHRDTLRRLAVAELRTALTAAHLWVEEYVTGDSAVRGRFGLALDAATASIDALRGRPRPSTAPPPLADPALQEASARVGDLAARFRELAERRQRDHEAGLPVGSASDVEYDLLFGVLLEETDRLSAAVARRQERDRARAHLLYLAILVTWALVVLSAVALVWLMERRRVAAERVEGESRSRLVQAQKMEAVGRLAGGMAHDINNYLGAIQLQSDVARLRAGADGDLARKMDAIARSVEKATSLIRQLLAFARRTPASPRTLDLNAVLTHELVDVMQRLLGENVELELRLEPALWSVHVDPVQIEQVVVNLLVNARDAMPRGGKVTIETRNRAIADESSGRHPLPPPGEWVVLVVTDSGLGIPEEIRGRIFDPFFTTKEQAGNSGLGLSTVHGIVTQSGGHVWVYSETGRGTTFHVYLPRRVAEPGSPAVAAEPQARPDVRGVERILLVEDNDELRESAREMLAALGYHVIAAPSAEAALQLLSSAGHLDAVISDVVLPGMSGKELVDRVRAVRPEVRVVFVSGHTDEVTLRHGIPSCHVDFLPKPFTALELAARLRAVLDGKPRAAGG